MASSFRHAGTPAEPTVGANELRKPDMTTSMKEVRPLKARSARAGMDAAAAVQVAA